MTTAAMMTSCSQSMAVVEVVLDHVMGRSRIGVAELDPLLRLGRVFVPMLSQVGSAMTSMDFEAPAQPALRGSQRAAKIAHNQKDDIDNTA